MQMRRIAISSLAGLLLLAPVAFADTVTTTEKTTTYSGVVSSVDPTASTIILKSETATAPSTYTYNEKTVFVDPQGNTVTYEAIKNSPVTVSYIQDGGKMVVTRVQATGPMIQKKTTTTTESVN
jgi:hypothetical protein